MTERKKDVATIMGKAEKAIKEQDFEKVLVDGSKEELGELKAWLFKENIRLELERSELNRMKDKLLKERQQFQTEMTEVNHRLVIERKRNSLALLAGNLNALSPLKKISSGYAYVSDFDDNKVNSVTDVKESNRIKLTLADGVILSKVIETKKQNL